MFKKLILLCLCLLLFGVVLSAAWVENSADATAELNQAEEYEKDGNYEEAEATYKKVATDFAGTDYALEAQKQLVMLYISMGKSSEADSALQELLVEFSTNEKLIKAVYDIAEDYRISEKHAKANQLYQYAMDNWPGHKFSMWSQMGVAKSSISLGDEAAAQAAIDQLVASFSGQERIVEGVFAIAEYYKEFNKYERTAELCQYILDTWPEDWLAMWSQQSLTLSNIHLGNIEAAETAIDGLLANFYDSPRVEEGVYEIAHTYKQFGRYERAKELYEYTLNNWPDATHTRWTQIGLAQTNIVLGEKEAAEAVIGQLIGKLATDFGGDSVLPVAAAEAYYYAGDCYRQLGEYGKSIECYQRVLSGCPEYEYAWNALFLIGRNYQGLKKSGVISKLEANTETRLAYEELLEKYPDCKAAKHAGCWLGWNNSK